MITFDGVDFSERRPEEVISLCWRSVYMYIYIFLFYNYDTFVTHIA